MSGKLYVTPTHLVSPRGTVLHPVEEHTAELVTGHTLHLGIIVVVGGLGKDRIQVHKIFLLGLA